MADTKDIVIDAAEKSLGRIASQAAKTLMGKSSPGYKPNVEAAPRVTIINASKLSISEKKALGKRYTRYTGYPGGLKTETLKMVSSRKGEGEALRRAIERMLPRNGLRKSRMKKLTIS